MKYDNYSTQSTSAKILKIANSRGKKPVMKDIEKARGIIADLLTEINPCEGKDALKQCDHILLEIIRDNI